MKPPLGIFIPGGASMKAFAVLCFLAGTIWDNNVSATSTTEAPQDSELVQNSDQKLTYWDLSFSGCGRQFGVGKSPWLARIKVENGERTLEGRLCYGVVISNVSILTSAYCLDQALHVREIKVTFSHNFGAQPESPKDFAIHQNYDLQGLKNNIAILNFEKSLLGDKVWPICLWNSELEMHGELIKENNGRATVIGRKARKRHRTGMGEFLVTHPRECMERANVEDQDFFDFGRICLTSIEENSRLCLEGHGTPMQFELDGRWFLRGLQDKKIQLLDSCASAITSYTDVARHLQFVYFSAKELAHSGIKDVEDEAAKSTLSYKTCGKRHASHATHLVAHGSPTEISEYPWQIAMYYLDFEPDNVSNVTLALTFHCGGALISKKFILTAAHCLLHRQITPLLDTDFRIIVGETFRIRLESQVPQDHVFRVDKFIPHPEFNGDNQAVDIGLIKLKGRVQFSKSVSPVCIWPDSADLKKILGKHAKVAGMGLMEGHTSAERLQMATMPILDNEDCSRIATNTKDYMICAGFTNGTGVCNGDSGGPLLLEENGRFFVRGIVSQGKSVSSNSSFCDYEYLALYTDVAKHRNWISGNSDVDFEYFEKPFVPATFNQASCGKPIFTKESLSLSGSSIRTKEKANITEFPWLVQIHYLDEGVATVHFMCTGTLISSKYVLAAGACVMNYLEQKIRDKDDFLLQLGKTFKIPARENSTAQMESIEVAKVKRVHTSLNMKNMDFVSTDIGLLELEEEVEFSDNIKPICIWSGPAEHEQIIGRDVEFAGWGILENYAKTDQLHRFTLSILPQSECSEIFGNITHSMICAGNKIGTNPCNGDSGSPLMLMEHGRFYARGILSVGKRNNDDATICDLGYPNLYVDILEHKKWIEENSDIKFDV